MIKKINKKEIIQKKHKRIRVKLRGTSECPRLAVYRSLKHIYAQIIDDSKHITLTSASSMDKDIRSQLKHGGNVESAKVIGETLAKKALALNIKDVVFDRGGFIYHGRIKALAEAAREVGLNF